MLKSWLFEEKHIYVNLESPYTKIFKQKWPSFTFYCDTVKMFIGIKNKKLLKYFLKGVINDLGAKMAILGQFWTKFDLNTSRDNAWNELNARNFKHKRKRCRPTVTYQKVTFPCAFNILFLYITSNLGGGCSNPGFWWKTPICQSGGSINQNIQTKMA